MRFILGFIFFGLLFYAMHVYFPDAFQTLVSWAGAVFDFIKDSVESIVSKFQQSNTGPSPSSSPQSLFRW